MDRETVRIICESLGSWSLRSASFNSIDTRVLRVDGTDPSWQPVADDLLVLYLGRLSQQYLVNLIIACHRLLQHVLHALFKNQKTRPLNTFTLFRDFLCGSDLSPPPFDVH